MIPIWKTPNRTRKATGEEKKTKQNKPCNANRHCDASEHHGSFACLFTALHGFGRSQGLRVY